MIAVAGILCHGNNDKAEANELSASHIAAQSPVDNSPAITNMARAFSDWNATKSDAFIAPPMKMDVGHATANA